MCFLCILNKNKSFIFFCWVWLSGTVLPRQNEVAIWLHHLANELRRGLQPLLQLPRRHLLRLAPWHRRWAMHPPLHLWPSRFCPLQARASLGKAVSINPNYCPCHQVKSHQLCLHLWSPHGLHWRGGRSWKRPGHSTWSHHTRPIRKEHQGSPGANQQACWQC